MMWRWMTWMIFVCTALPPCGAEGNCEEALDSLRQSLREDDFEVYARMLRRDAWFTCELDGDLLVLLQPERRREFEESLERMGVNLMDTSLQRIVWEQARWSLLSREQRARFPNSNELAAPQSVMVQVNWTWWLGCGCFVLSLALLLRGWGLKRASRPETEGKGGWTADVVEFGKSLEAARTPKQFGRALFWLRFTQFNDQMLDLKKEEWTRLSRRERELYLMLLEHWDAQEICDVLHISMQHYYKLRSKIRASLHLDANDQLKPALKAWSNRE